MLQALSLPSELTIYTVGELRPLWLDWLSAARQAQADGELTDGVCPVNAAAVDEIDAAGLQLLMALSHSLAGSRLNLTLADASDPLTAACQALGVQHLLSQTPAHALPQA